MRLRPVNSKKLGVALLLCMASPFIYAQKPASARKCKELAIQAAVWAKQSYTYVKEAYMTYQPSVADICVDSSAYCIAQSVIKLDSCIALASDSDFLGVSFARMAKKDAQKVRNNLGYYKQVDKQKRKREFIWDATAQATQTVIDAYHASFYFEDDSVAEKKPEPPPVVEQKEKQITRLDVDQALFVLLNEQLQEKTQKTKAEIEKLQKQLKATKDPAKIAKLKEELKKLEQKESTTARKNMETSEKLSKINGLIEERDKNAGQVKNEETVFSKSMRQASGEWNKQVIMDTELPEGLIYQVQIGVYKNNISMEVFKGITPVYGKTVPGGVSYSTGMFERISDAKEAKDYVVSMGLGDAFIVAFHNKKKITLAEAAKLEKK